MFRRFAVGPVLCLLATASIAWAQTYPAHPVRIIVGFAAGSGPDIQARTIAQQLATDLGQPFYIENRPGANGTIAARTVAQSEGDGYTLLFSSSSIAPTPYFYPNLGYDTLKDLRPIATSGVLDGLLMLVDAKSQFRTARDFIDYAKTHRLMYGSPGVGNILHIATEMFCTKAGISMQHVPYKGASEVMVGLLGGSVQVMFVTPPSVIGLLKQGTVRALAYTGSKPFPEFPDVPLLKDIVPGFQPIGSWGMFFAPGKTPTPIVDRLNAAVRHALTEPAVAKVMVPDGYVPDNRNAAETAEYFRRQVEAVGEAVHAAKLGVR